ncbi:hypothetical protein Hypma_006884 [Hypsizygus marmoreus]|uniref:MARVEL domain-containing protein n=1 Tax=Hypsizygus marmoreus TaxID=39966 RepID=A0A369K1F0_HYPMA|nr:hypothetical protein Hypma_006884 [Hypsizygus marmoreus]
MTFIAIFRYIALGMALFFGLIALGLTAHWTKGSLAGNIFFDFEIVGIIAGGLSALAIPVLLVVGLIRRKAFTSMIIVELPVLTVLWVLWLATAAVVSQWGNVFYPFGCGDFLPGSDAWCRELFAIEGMSFIIWIALFLYTLTLLIFSLIGRSRGNPVWTVSANEAIFFDRPGTDQTFVPTYGSTGAPIDTGLYAMPPLVQQFQHPPAGTTPTAQANPAEFSQYSVSATPVVGVAAIHARDSRV